MENGTNGNKKGNGIMLVVGLCHLAKAPIFYPSKDGDAKHGHAQATGLINTGMGTEVSATLNFWGHYADVACCHLETGSRIFIIGEMTTFNQDTGAVDGGGKKIYRRLTEVKVSHMQFAGATKKQIGSRIKANWVGLMAAGRIPANLPLTDELLEAILKVDAKPTVAFNMANAIATGLHGNARVMVNKQYIGPQNPGAVPATAADANANNNALAAMQKMLDDQKKIIADLVAQKAAPAPGVEVVDEVPAGAQAVEAVDAFAGAAIG